MLQQDVIPLILIGHILQVDVREKAGVINIVFSTNFAQCDEEGLATAFGAVLTGFDTIAGTLDDGFKSLGLCCSLREDVILKGSILQWRNADPAPSDNR